MGGLIHIWCYLKQVIPVYNNWLIFLKLFSNDSCREVSVKAYGETPKALSVVCIRCEYTLQEFPHYFVVLCWAVVWTLMLKISRELNSCEANISKALSENLNERDYYLVFLVSLKCHYWIDHYRNVGDSILGLNSVETLKLNLDLVLFYSLT